MHRRLEESQWWSPQALATWQTGRLRAFLIDIGQRVPYYQSLFAMHGFDPRRLQSAADLQALPLLTKATIRAQGAQLRALGHGPQTRYSTGGSSGEPLVFFIGKERKSHDVAAKWRATRWWGVDIGDPELVLWGSPIELGAQDRLRRLRDALLRSHLLPAFDMGPRQLDGMLAQLIRLRPAMLFGYPSSLALLAGHALRQGVDLTRLGIRVAFVTSERLYDAQRTLISSVFACPVANGYGARDAGFIAHECPAGSLHISAEDIVVETLRPDGRPAAPGELGEIVVTHLDTADFPFVRYRTGDMGTLATQPCSCGRGLPVLAEVQGRSTDFVLARDGRVLHGLALIYILRELPQIAQFQIHQTALDCTRVRLVAQGGLDAACCAHIVRAFQARLGAGVRVEIEQVQAIAAAPSGKYRYVLSELDAFAPPAGAACHA
jgi:phenylacetate-CoA ligase